MRQYIAESFNNFALHIGREVCLPPFKHFHRGLETHLGRGCMRFQASSRNCETWLSAPTCLSVRMHGTIRIPLQWFIWKFICQCGPGSVVGIATAYGLDGPGIESRWGEIFRTSPDRPWGTPNLLYNGYRVFPRGRGAAGTWRWPLTPF